MPRRIHVRTLQPGEVSLDETQAHHLRDVLRLSAGEVVELFENSGACASATITRADAAGVLLFVDRISPPAAAVDLTIASAVPKGDRADWMIEKLSELGVARFIPLQTARSVVHPRGHGKRDRWLRIATEAAKQSRRTGVMRIESLTPVEQLAASHRASALYLSTENMATPIMQHLAATVPPSAMMLLIGPEGGWTPGEIAYFASTGLTGVKLTATILRVETAAIAAAVAAVLLLRPEVFAPPAPT